MSNLLINEPPLQVLPSLAVAIGLNEAIVLQQLHYWLAHATVKHDGKLWVYKTYDQWKSQDFPFWSIDTIKRALTSLKDKGLVLVAQIADNSFNRVNHYAVNYEELNKISKESSSNPLNTDEGNLQQSKSENQQMLGGNLPQSDEGKMHSSDESKMHSCLREYKENTKENKKEIFFEVHNLKATLEQIQSHFVRAGVLVKFDETLNIEVLRQELYQFNLNYHHVDLPPNKVWSNLVAWFKRKSHKDLARFNAVSHDEQLAPSHVVAPVIQEPIQQLSREERLAKIAQIEKAMGVNRAT